MGKFYTIIAIIGITLALIAAEPPQFRQLRRLSNLRIQNNSKLFARQEQARNAAASSAPYPPAGVIPEIPFDLPTETETPLAEPDQTYGPPESIHGQSYLPPMLTPDQTYGPPNRDQTYGPPEAEDIPAITEPATSDDQREVEDVSPSERNLVSENRIHPRQILRTRSRSDSLRSHSPAQRSRPGARLVQDAKVQLRFNELEIVNSEPVLIYTLH